MCVCVISGDEPRCKNVKCPKVNPPDCKGIIPPGACCPHCGKNLYIETCDTHPFRKTWKDKIYFRLKPAIILDFFEILESHIEDVETSVRDYVFDIFSDAFTLVDVGEP